MAKKEDKVKQIIEDINSGNSEKVKKAITFIETNGDVSIIQPLCQLLLSDLSDEIRKQILELFSSFKHTGAASEMMTIINDEKFNAIRHSLLVTVWNTKVDYSYYIDDFVEIATQGDFMDAVECLTIIENMEGPFMEESILECQLHLKNYLEENPKKGDAKAEILSEIALQIKAINDNLAEY